MSAPGRLGVGVVGAGRTGCVLGAALAGAGHAVVGLSAVSAASRDRAEAMLPGVPVLQVSEVVARSELVLLAVPTAELPDLVAGLARTDVWRPGQLVVHTAPGLGTAVLGPARGCIPLAVSPALVLTGTTVDLARLRDARFAVTAPGPVLPIAQALVVEMGGEPVVVAEEDRPAWAAALESVRAHVGDTLAAAAALLDAAAVPDPARVLGPVARTAVEAALDRVARPLAPVLRAPEDRPEESPGAL